MLLHSFNFQQVLRTASTESLEHTINDLERPWEPGRNDKLRGLWHDARRKTEANPMSLHVDLADAIVREIAFMPQRDRDHVARKYGWLAPDPTGDDIARLVAVRLTRTAIPCVDPRPAFSLDHAFELLTETARFGSAILFASQSSYGSRSHGSRGRGHRRHRRHGY